MRGFHCCTAHHHSSAGAIYASPPPVAMAVVGCFFLFVLFLKIFFHTRPTIPHPRRKSARDVYKTRFCHFFPCAIFSKKKKVHATYAKNEVCDLRFFPHSTSAFLSAADPISGDVDWYSDDEPALGAFAAADPPEGTRPHKRVEDSMLRGGFTPWEAEGHRGNTSRPDSIIEFASSARVRDHVLPSSFSPEDAKTKALRCSTEPIFDPKSEMYGPFSIYKNSTYATTSYEVPRPLPPPRVLLAPASACMHPPPPPAGK